ncbi:hypothetical protein Tsubulata_035278 [Turnera subulata]|uniref:KIB1-4 beta-propeller domain-containing protein n=1 Tax=Turnera subulata TaxID=218843 RepID=A0A9Q0JN69_9ROSI|nr:hypothetical protein Tsubulata_035278 [Turnera subulata]
MMDSLDFRVGEICNDYLLEEVACPIRFPFRVAVASGFSKIGDRFIVMASIRGRLVAWRMGDDKWTSVLDNANAAYGASFSNIFYIRGKFYACGWRGLVITVDPDSLNTTQLAHAGENCLSSVQPRWVSGGESSGLTNHGVRVKMPRVAIPGSYVAMDDT